MPTASAKAAPGKTGAKVMSFDENAARVFVKRVMEQYPLDTREQIVVKVRQRVLPKALTGEAGKFLPSFVDYATINAWRAIKNGEHAADDLPQTSTTPVKGASSDKFTGSGATLTIKSAAELEDERHIAEQRRIAEREQAKKDVKLVLLDLVSPSGKLWRELSIAEYMDIGVKQQKHGAKLLAEGHKKSELLNTATNEDEIQKVFKR